ncbi:MAG: T9SS type A sorting domain-containing protein [Bacteroidetes bacterium]|nr:T9SS type A sorting domain-containing protein [Bacteroidota bacterium]
MSRLKKFIPLTFIVFLSIFTVLISIEWEMEIPGMEENEEEPGFFEQFKLMKQNENGEYPSGLWKEWSRQTRSMFKAQFFSDVREIGPTNIGGRIRAIAVDYDNKDRWIAGSVSGGIWVTENAAASWTPLDDDATTLSVSAITQSPFNHKVFYYSTGEVSTGVYINYDGYGIFKSVDGGKSFQHLDSSNVTGFEKTWDIEHSRTDSNTFYVATIGNGLWRSRDGGESFEQLFKSSSDINDVDALNDGTVYFTRSGSGVYRFKEQDTVQIEHLNNNGLPTSAVSRVVVEPCLSDPSVVYAAFAGTDRASLAGLYKSTDYGKSFVELTTGGSASYDQTWYNFLFKVDPENPDFILMGGVNAEYSKDGGKTWSVLTSGHTDFHNAFYIPGTSDFVTVSDGGLYIHNKTTASSTAKNGNTNLNITQFYCGACYPTGDKVIVGAQDNWTSINVAGGSTFVQKWPGDGAYNAVSEDGQTLYCSSQNGYLGRSTNGGNSFQSIYYGLANKVGTTDFWFVNPFELNKRDATNVFFPTKNVVAVTSNSGSSWKVITKTIPGNIFSIGITNEESPTVYFGGQSSLLYRIPDANNATPGDEFKMFTLAPAEARGGFIGNIEVDPNDNSTIFLAMNNTSTLPRIWKVLNADTESPTWVNVSANLPTGLPVNWIEIDPKNSDHIMIATDYGLYVTVNGGGWWEKETRIPNVYISMIRLRESDRRLFIFTYGRGVWVADLEENIFSSSKLSANLSASVKIYPNPASDYVQIEGASGKYEIFDLQGSQIATGTTNSGDKIPTSYFKNGLYFIRVYDPKGTVTRKLVLQH